MNNIEHMAPALFVISVEILKRRESRKLSVNPGTEFCVGAELASEQDFQTGRIIIYQFDDMVVMMIMPLASSSVPRDEERAGAGMSTTFLKQLGHIIA